MVLALAGCDPAKSCSEGLRSGGRRLMLAEMPRSQKRVLIALGWYVTAARHREIRAGTWLAFVRQPHARASHSWGWDGDGILAWLGAGDDLAEFVGRASCRPWTSAFAGRVELSARVGRPRARGGNWSRTISFPRLHSFPVFIARPTTGRRKSAARASSRRCNAPAIRASGSAGINRPLIAQTGKSGRRSATGWRPELKRRQNPWRFLPPTTNKR